MIAPLRNGLADGSVYFVTPQAHRALTTIRASHSYPSLSVIRHHRTIAKYCSRSRHIHYFSIRATERLSWKVSDAVALRSRHVSSAPSTTTKSPAKDVPPVPNTILRKHKVELRPRPASVKPSETFLSFDSSSNLKQVEVASSRRAGDHAPLSQLSNDSSTASTSASSTPHSVIETVKEDYYDASKHGILTPPPEGASWPRKLYHQAKELFKFYWNGVKLINTHRLRVRAIQTRVKAGGSPLSRWETRFIANYRQDALKLIPFVLIILIAEEAIPLVVIYVPFLLPSTCLLPSQKERIDNQRREKQKSCVQSMKPVFERVHSRALTELDASAEVLLDRTAARSYNGILSLSTFGFPQMRLRRLKKHLAFIAADDALLSRENWGERLNGVELREALEERGIVTDGLSTEVMRSRLRWWLAETHRSDDPVRQRLLLVAANAIGKHTA